MGTHEVVGKGYVFTKISQMASVGAIFTSTYHTKQLNPWPNSSASRVVNHSRLSACQGDMEPFEGNPSTRGRLTSLRNKPYTAKAAKATFSINTCLNCFNIDSETCEYSQRSQLTSSGMEYRCKHCKCKGCRDYRTSNQPVAVAIYVQSITFIPQ